jgi:hypothetical protein
MASACLAPEQRPCDNQVTADRTYAQQLLVRQHHMLTTQQLLQQAFGKRLPRMSPNRSHSPLQRPQPAPTQHSTAQHSTAQHSTAQHSTAQHYLMLCPDDTCHISMTAVQLVMPHLPKRLPQFVSFQTHRWFAFQPVLALMARLRCSRAAVLLLNNTAPAPTAPTRGRSLDG